MTLLKCQPIENTWPTFEDVIDAYRSCVLRKNSKYQQILFETHLGNELIQLYNDLTNNTYYPKKSFSFLISEPKLREIFAPDFRDRIVHHLIVKKLEKFWVPKFSAQSFACIKGRGHHKALDELQRLVRKISKGARQDVHVLKMDIASFYVTIHRPTLWKIVEKTIRSPKLAKLTQMIIEHDARKNYKKIKSFTKESIPKHKSWLSQPRDCGIPIGNLTSQFFANVYLNELDHFITRKLKPMGYIRYMDDLLLLHRDPAEILNFISPIELWLLENRKQKIHPNKTIIANLCDGIEFLGYIVRQENFPKFPVQFYLPPIKKWKFVSECRRIENKKTPDVKIVDRLFYVKSRKHITKNLCSINAHLGQAKHARTFRFREKSLQKIRLDPELIVREDNGAIKPI